MSKYYRVYADVELGNIESNVEALMALTPAGTKSLAVVKADGYGHGDVAVAKAVYSKVFGYAVATLDEAVNLRENGIDKPILILGFVNIDEYETLVENEVAATVFDYETAEELSEAAKKTGKTAICPSCFAPPKFQWEAKKVFHSSFVIAEHFFCSAVGTGALPCFLNIRMNS